MTTIKWKQFVHEIAEQKGYTIWYLDLLGDPLIWQVMTNGQPPSNEAGYHNLYSLLVLKGIV